MQPASTQKTDSWLVRSLVTVGGVKAGHVTDVSYRVQKHNPKHMLKYFLFCTL
jgi:hypothetical protein